MDPQNHRFLYSKKYSNYYWLHLVSIKSKGDNMRTIGIGLCIAFIIIAVGFTSQINPTIPNKVSYSDMIPSAKKQIDCLAKNIYYEAGNQSDDGKIAVALVTMNRVKSGDYANSVCNVVKEKHGNVCQFSWWCENKSKIMDRNMFIRSRDVALYVYLNHDKVSDITKGATFYHADYVQPGWDKLKKTTKIGAHIFYKSKKENNNYDEQTQLSSWWKFKPTAEFVSVTDGRHFTPVL